MIHSEDASRDRVIMFWKNKRYTKDVKPTYTFAQLLGEIQTALNVKVQAGSFHPDTLLILLEGFIYTPIQPNVGGNYIIGGPAIPMVGAVGNNTGQVYYFPLKALVPRVEL